MEKGRFIWADLSTYNVSKSLAFYASVFDWKFSDEAGYYLLSNSDAVIAGLYETPPFFKKIKMPHFWMSYFQVPSVSDASKIAASMGGKVELTDIPFYNGNISLIRDPMGAGFTVYDGQDLQIAKDSNNKSILKTELHTSNLEEVMPFYAAVFDWTYEKVDETTVEVLINNQKSNIQLKQIPNTLKGNYEYWVLTFSILKLEVTKNRLLKEGAQIIIHEENKLLISDDSNEAFFYLES